MMKIPLVFFLLVFLLFPGVFGISYWVTNSTLDNFSPVESGYPTAHDFNFMHLNSDGNLTQYTDMDWNSETENQVLSDLNLQLWVSFDDSNATHFLDKTTHNTDLRKTGAVGNNYQGILGTRNAKNASGGTLTADKAVIDISKPFSVMFWLTYDHSPSAVSVIENKSQIEIDNGTGPCSGSGQLASNIFSANWCWGASSGLSSSAINHVALTFDGTNLKGYLNGALVATKNSGFTAANNSDLVVLQDTWPFDDFRVYDRTVSATDINRLYYEAFFDRNLMAYWKFNDDNGTHVQDLSLYNMDLSLGVGADTNVSGFWDSNGLFKIGTASAASSMAFDISKQYTWIGWIKPTTGSEYIASNSSVMMWLQESVVYLDNDQVNCLPNSGSPVSLGAWNQVAVTINTAASINFYMNGAWVGVGLSDCTGFWESVTPSQFQVGDSTTGQTEQFKVYDRILSDAEILADYRGTNNLYHYYSRIFDGNESGVCTDCNFSKFKARFSKMDASMGVAYATRICADAVCSANPAFSSYSTVLTNLSFDMNSGKGYRGRYFQYAVKFLSPNTPTPTTFVRLSDVNVGYHLIDSTAPTTTADYNTNLQSMDANVLLTCSDSGGSGCALTQYRLDSDSSTGVSMGVWQTFDQNILISQDGNWAVDFNSTDGSGNVETTNRIYILISHATGSSAGTSSSIVCGNNVCQESEHANSCPRDCPAECGDRACTHTENADSCPVDCAAGCGNRICDAKEDKASCPIDCGYLSETVLEERSLSTIQVSPKSADKIRSLMESRMLDAVLLDQALEWVSVRRSFAVQLVSDPQGLRKRTRVLLEITNTSDFPLRDVRLPEYFPSGVLSNWNDFFSFFPYTAESSQNAAEFNLAGILPKQTVEVEYFLSSELSEQQAESFSLPFAVSAIASTMGEIEKIRCVSNADCEDANLCTANRCISDFCYALPLSEGESCDVGSVCRQGACTRISSLYEAGNAVDFVLLATIGLVVVALAAIAFEYYRS